MSDRDDLFLNKVHAAMPKATHFTRYTCTLSWLHSILQQIFTAGYSMQELVMVKEAASAWILSAVIATYVVLD